VARCKTLEDGASCSGKGRAAADVIVISDEKEDV
jgi:hypothetical protein